MPNFDSFDSELQSTIQGSLQAIAVDLGEPIDDAAAAQLYQEAVSLIDHVAYEPITLARLAGTLLVYQSQQLDRDELKWFKNQVRECEDDEAIEELIESLHRIDAL